MSVVVLDPFFGRLVLSKAAFEVTSSLLSALLIKISPAYLRSEARAEKKALRSIPRLRPNEIIARREQSFRTPQSAAKAYQ